MARTLTTGRTLSNRNILAWDINYSPTVLADNPIRYYRLGETSGTSAADSGSQGQNGTLNGGITLNQPSLISQGSNPAMLFNGSSGYISLPTTGLPTGTAAWSMGCWVKMPQTLPSSGFPVAMMFGANNSNQGAYITLSAAARRINLTDWAGTVIAGPIAVAGAIYHLVATYSGATAKLYSNGALVSSAAKTFNIGSTLAVIGADTTAGDYWNGIIDEAGFYSTALSPAQIAWRYSAGASKAARSTLANRSALA